jgi:hypothetical protein
VTARTWELLLDPRFGGSTMKKQLIISIVAWFAISNFYTQAQDEKAPTPYFENVVVHTNTDFLITGETLYYSIHCLEAKENQPSLLSKLAYVELIGENEKPLLQTKISLVEGRGAGDFFLPSTVPSGNYTLIAYTKWMRNFPLDYFFQKQITIINPYLKSVTSENRHNVEKIIDSSSQKISESSQLYLNTDKKQYSARAKVMISIQNNDLANACKISLNVHQHDNRVEKISKVLESDFQKSRNVPQPSRKEFVNFLPDLRGETISGIVSESNSHQPLANTVIYLSAPGTTYLFQISRTDSKGRFYFNAKHIQTTGIQFQVERPSESESVDIMLDDEFVSQYAKFKPLPLSIDTSVRSQIQQRNVYSQIENAYFKMKRDSILDSIAQPFFGTPDKIYILDDFTRFPSMEDIFREYMYEVVVSKRNEKFIIQLMNKRNGSRFSNAPLILIDGIRVFDIETLMSYNPLLIKTVSLIRNRYIYAGILFDGILSINTYTGNAKDLPIAITQKEYTPWQPTKNYFSPKYNVGANLDKIPDYRVQLFWNPIINLEPGQKFIGEFYTSDIDGDFLISVKGFNSKGEEISIGDTINIKK